MTLTHGATLSFQIGDKCIDDIATGMPSHIYPVFDLYGKCDRITIINTEARSPMNDELPAHFVTNGNEEAPTQCEKGNLEVHEKELEQFNTDTM